MSEVYTASVVGAGSGTQLSIQALAAMSHMDSDKRAKVRAGHPEIRIYADFAEMMRTDPTDIVCVSTWAPSHTDGSSSVSYHCEK